MPAIMQSSHSQTSSGEVWAAWLQRVPAMLAMLQQWIAPRAADAGWYLEQIAVLQSARAGDKSLNILFKALGFTPRKVGKRDLALSVDELADADALRRGFDPSRWSADQAARVGLIVSYAAHLADCNEFARLLSQLSEQGDIQEQIALYQGFALFPNNAALVARAREAVRSGMRPVFAAMALRNPWPQETFDDVAWNQMVVKTFFLELPLWPIQGIAPRANADLSGMLLDLAAERRAAGRTINPELWRVVALCPGERGMRALEYMAAQGDVHQLQSLALACRGSHVVQVQALCRRLRSRGAVPEDLHWSTLAQWQE